MFEADVRGDSALLYTKISAVFQGAKFLSEMNVTSPSSLKLSRFCQMILSTLASCIFCE